eukprot:9279173-Pyramimonas_sp.AAC.1
MGRSTGRGEMSGGGAALPRCARSNDAAAKAAAVASRWRGRRGRTEEGCATTTCRRGSPANMSPPARQS